jgi:hypothetical protein
MRSPRRVCSNGSSQTAHSLPTNVLSRRVRLLSVSSIPAIPPGLARLRESLDNLVSFDRSEVGEGGEIRIVPWGVLVMLWMSIEKGFG